MYNRLGEFTDRHLSSIAISYLSTLVVVLGVLAGQSFVVKCHTHDKAISAKDFISSCAAWDGQWYVSILEGGYQYNQNRKSNVVFFPGYPLLAWCVKCTLGCSDDFALLLVSNTCFILSAVVMREYLLARVTEKAEKQQDLILLLFCALPNTVYFRMAYSESLFILLCISILYGIQKKWPIWKVAVLVGAATGTRSMGVVMLAPLLLYIWERTGNVLALVVTSFWAMPLSIWGIILFMSYLWLHVGDPLIFMKAQSAWEFREIPSISGRLWDLVTLEPVWSTYSSNDKHLYWNYYPPLESPEFNLLFWNPIYWMTAIVACVTGSKAKVLNRAELLTCAGLLLLPYYLQGARAGMMSCARYSSVAFPLYIVYASWLGKAPEWFRNIAIGLAMIYLFINSALFTQWYWFF